MDFYNYKVKDIRKEIVDFNKGTYGKTIFVIAYSIPLILAIVAVLVELLGTPGNIICCYADYLSFWILSILFSFIIGSAYYYVELRKFMEHKICHHAKEVQKATKKSKKNLQ